MPKRKPDVLRPLGTIWQVPEQAWERIKPILDEAYRPKPTGRPRIDFRAALNGIIYRARTGCQWNHLPREFGDDSSARRSSPLRICLRGAVGACRGRARGRVIRRL
jgi:transposase